MRALGALAALLPLLGCTAGAGGTCSPACGDGRTCCSGTCVNTNNDPKNCGACGSTCGTFCSGGQCTQPPCTRDGGSCANGALCCGGDCCASGQLCCDAEGPVGGLPPSCVTPASGNGTCPQGCSPLCVSDRAQKAGAVPVNEREVLDRVAALPISTWSYTTDPAATRHIGPMAQDFRDAFSLGFTEKSYDPIDAHGVTLASIKALSQQLDAQRVRIEKLEAENAALKNRVCR